VAKKQNSFEEYLKNLDLNMLFEKLGLYESEFLAREVEHFTVKEAEQRDRILINYFGDEGINRIVDRIVELLFASPMLPAEAKVLGGCWFRIFHCKDS